MGSHTEGNSSHSMSSERPLTEEEKLDKNILDELEELERLERVSGPTHHPHMKFKLPWDSSSHQPESPLETYPSLFSNIVANAVNFSRYTYALAKEVAHFTSTLGTDITNHRFHLDRPRSLVIDVNDADSAKKTNGFNNTLELFKDHLVDNFEVLKYYEVEEIGGTSYIAKFDGLLNADGSKVEEIKNDFPKSIIVAFRGTHGLSEWFKTNFHIHFTQYEPLNEGSYDSKHTDFYKGLKVHAGFYSALRSLTPVKKGGVHDIFGDLKEILKENPDHKLIITGHSLGGALASLFGFEAQALGYHPTVISIASPQVAFFMDGIVDATPDDSSSDDDGDIVERNRALYQKKILNLFDITTEKELDDKTSAVKSGRVKDILNPKESFFINVIHDGDYVPLVPSLLFQPLGGFPFHIDNKVQFPDPEKGKPYQQLYLDVDYLQRSKKALETDGDNSKSSNAAIKGKCRVSNPGVNDSASHTAEPTKGLLDPNLIRSFEVDDIENYSTDEAKSNLSDIDKAYEQTSDSKFKKYNTKNVTRIKAVASSQNVSIGRVLSALFNNLLVTDRDYYISHVFYGLFMISDEYKNVNFPMVEQPTEGIPATENGPTRLAPVEIPSNVVDDVLKQPVAGGA